MKLPDAARLFFHERPSVHPTELPGRLEEARAQLRRQFPYVRTPRLDQAAVQAWAEVESARCRAYVDLASSTPHMISLVDLVAGERRQIPVGDLVRLLGPRAAA